jgi:hypothetical protein
LLEVEVAEVVNVEDDLEASTGSAPDGLLDPAGLRPVKRVSERRLNVLPAKLEPDQPDTLAREVIEGRLPVVVVVVAPGLLFEKLLVASS